MLSGAVVYPAGILVAVLIVATRGISGRTVLALVAVAHLTILASVALFPLPVDPGLIARVRAHVAVLPPDDGLNLVPFRTIGQVLAGRGGPDAALQLAQNTFLLFPAGIVLPALWPVLRGRRAVLPFVVLGGASVELAQLAVSTVLGFRYRSIDVDDVIANTVGLALGWLVVALTVAVANRRSRRRR